ncbi:MAG TPA: ABC transporter ATP-binding protein [Prolixibacteraceae bacterium]|nr:ABC transporter ATP-binding protein [Prolixibacteraceae bacterium]HPR61524.1 ABC transporter ATP-binding protein [Prolixibacteraceae bacterium]
MITTENITKSFGMLKVLKGVDLKIEKGKIVSIVGASGAGKTTLLQILGTLSRPDGGLLNINGHNPLKMNEKELAAFRNKHIGFVFQFHHLLPEFTAFENVCLPGYISNKSKPEVEKRASELLNSLGLSERLQHKPNELSGGEKQRVAVARALINQPSVIFADEPTGNLDSKNQEELHELFFSLRDKYGITLVIVTHDRDFARMSDVIFEIKDGMIIK